MANPPNYSDESLKAIEASNKALEKQDELFKDISKEILRHGNILKQIEGNQIRITDQTNRISKIEQLRTDNLRKREDITRQIDINARAAYETTLIATGDISKAQISEINERNKLLGMSDKEINNLDKINKFLNLKNVRAKKNLDNLNLFNSALDVTQKKLVKEKEITDAWKTSLIGASGELGARAAELYNTFKLIVANPLTAVVILLALAVKQFVSMDLAAESFRRKIGLTIKQTAAIRVEAERITREFANSGVTIDKANESAAELAETFFGNARVIKENMQFVALMSAHLGVAEGDSAKVLQTFMGISGVSSATAQNLSLYAGELSRAAGVPFSKVMKDIAGLSERSLAAFRGNSLAMIKATIEARRLGTTVKDIVNSTSSLLDFENTFNSEMELSVLLGKNVNLMEMRRKAMAGDIVELAKEQAKFLQDQHGLTGKNVFQIEAMAKAMGLSVDALTKMSAQQELENDLLKESHSSNKEIADAANRVINQRKAYDALQKSSMTDVKKSAAERSAEMLKQNQMQSDMNAMVNELKKMGLTLGSILYPIVKLLASVLVPTLQFISDILNNKWVKGLVGIAAIATGIYYSIIGIGAAFSIIGTAIAAISSGAAFSALIAGITTISSTIGIAIGAVAAVIGWPILIAAGIALIGVAIWKYLMPQACKDAIIDGITSVGSAIWETLTGAFDSAWKWIKSLWGGNSPSEIGLSIVKGLSSVGGMILDFLVSPWKLAWNLIKKIPFVGKLFGGNSDMSVSVSKEAEEKNPITDILNSINSLGSKLGNILTTLQLISEKMISGVTSTTATSDQGVSAIRPNEYNDSTNVISDKTDTQQAVVKKLDELISLMKAGGIAINLDGKRVSEQLAYAVA